MLLVAIAVVWNMNYLIPTDVWSVEFHLKGSTRARSKHRWELVPVTQTGAGSVVTYLKKAQHICSVIHYVINDNFSL